MELICVIAIMGILMAVAGPSYSCIQEQIFWLQPKRILNRQTGKNSVPELLPEIMMQLLSDIASLKKYLFPMNDKKIQSYSRLMRSKKDFVK